MNMQTLIFFSILLLLNSITAAIGSENDIELTGAHDRVLLSVPQNWMSYGQVGADPIAGVSLTPKPPAIDDSRRFPTASIRADVESPGSCASSDASVRSEITEFDQRQVSKPENLVLQGKKAKIIHTRNNEADYLHVCVTLRKDRIFLTLTVSTGSDAKFFPRYKKDFIWALQHVSVTGKDEASKR